MPAKTEKQRRFMAMCLHSPGKAYKKCPSKTVAREFVTMVPKAKRDKRGFYK